mgnify:CR=1 FL=1
MSFNDLNLNSGGSGEMGRVQTGRQGGDPLQLLSGALQKYNGSANSLKQFVMNIKPGRTSRSDLENKLKVCRDCESFVKVHLSSSVKKLSQEDKNNVAQKRLAVSKLQKDYERVKQVVDSLAEQAESKMAQAGAPQGRGTGVGDKKGPGAVPARDGGVESRQGSDFNVQGGPRVLQKLQGYEVDEAIAEERERDIIKINEDLKLVNEMFKDVAQLVEEQNPAIEQIVQATEESHERAEAGLEQVQQAARHQAGCVMS